MTTELSSFNHQGQTSLPLASDGHVSLATDPASIPPNLPPIDYGRQAWLFCISASALEMLVWGSGFSFGVFQAYYTSHPPFSSQSPIAISAIGASGLGIQYFEGLALMALIQTRPEWMRGVMWACLGLCTACLGVSSFCTKVWQLILVQGVVFGMGAGILYFPVIFWLYEWFNERRSLAGGIIFGGSGLGGVIFPLMASYLLEEIGYQWTLRIWAAMFAILGSLTMYGAKPRIPVYTTRDRSYNLQGYLKQFRFVSRPLFLSCMILLQGLGYFPVSLYMPTYTSTLGLPPLNGSLVLATFNFVSVVGQIIVGYMCDKMPYVRVMIYSAIFSAVAAFTLLGFASSLSLIFVFVVIFGSLAGGFSSVWTAAAVETSDGDPSLRAPVFLGLAWSRGIAAIMGPVIAGGLYDRRRETEIKLYGGHGFGNVIIFVGIMMFATGFLGAGTALWKKNR